MSAAFVRDHPAAVMASMPTMAPVPRPKSLFEFSVSVNLGPFKASPEVMDYLMHGQSPGPHIVLGED